MRRRQRSSTRKLFSRMWRPTQKAVQSTEHQPTTASCLPQYSSRLSNVLAKVCVSGVCHWCLRVSPGCCVSLAIACVYTVFIYNDKPMKWCRHHSVFVTLRVISVLYYGIDVNHVLLGMSSIIVWNMCWRRLASDIALCYFCVSLSFQTTQNCSRSSNPWEAPQPIDRLSSIGWSTSAAASNDITSLTCWPHTKTLSPRANQLSQILAVSRAQIRTQNRITSQKRSQIKNQRL